MQMRLKRMFSFAIGIILVGMLAASSEGSRIVRINSTTEMPLIYALHDSVWLFIGDEKFPAPLKDLHKFDTTVVSADSTFSVIGDGDTLILKPAELPLTFAILTSSDTIFETFVLSTDTGRPSDNTMLELLRQYSRFPQTVSREYPPIPVRAVSDRVGKSVAMEFRLDSVAGTGDEISRALRLLHWVHGSVRWDGSKPNPDVPSGREMLGRCVKENQTANCGGLAMMLTAVLRAEGFAARSIVCRPYDTADQECHSVTIVYVDAFKKWIFLDPTNDAYVQDVSGEFLSPLQMRDGLAKGDSLMVFEGINVNGTPLSVGGYLTYLSKNLFRFSCWIELPATGSETQGRWCEVFLNPTGYGRDGSAQTESNESTNCRMNPAGVSHFFAAP